MKVALIVVLIAIAGCSPRHELNFFVGLWKVEGKDKYEVWSMQEDGSLEGESYKMVDGEKVALEKLVITRKQGQIVYQATVPDQNEGQTISFALNNAIKDKWQFENPDHDFPKKIIYEKVLKDRFYVQVLGDSDEGFSFYMERE